MVDVRHHGVVGFEDLDEALNKIPCYSCKNIIAKRINCQECKQSGLLSNE